MMSRDFITIKDVIFFKFDLDVYRKNVSRSGTSEPIIQPILTELYQT